MSDLLELDRSTETLNEPAKGWRNKWRCVETGAYWPGILRLKGEVYFYPSLEVDPDWPHFPSKELAEENAARAIEWNLHNGFPADDYIGAIPVAVP